jgi:hypothetical protein
MRVLINDKPVEALTPKQERDFMLSKVQQDVKAAVLTPAEANATYIAQTRRWFMILGGIAIILMLAIAIAGLVGDPMDGTFIAVAALVIGGTFGLFMYWLLGHRIRTWKRKVQQRSEGLPPAGTAVFLDSKSLSIGAEIFAWPQLAIDQIELTQGSLSSDGQTTTIYVLERLSLSAGTKAIVLDRAMMQNGLLLVDNAWRKLRS